MGRPHWLGLALFAGLTTAVAEEARVGAPAELAIPRADAPARRLVVTVTGYVPSHDGPVEAVILAGCRDGAREIGRFGIFPAVPFSAAEPERAQRFGFAWPPDLACADAKSVTVQLEAVAGDGRAARLEIGAIAFE